MQPWYLFRTFLTETFCMQPESKYEDTKLLHYITHLVCPKFSSVSVERTVVVGLSKQGLDREKDGADLSTIKLHLMITIHLDFIQIYFFDHSANLERDSSSQTFY